MRRALVLIALGLAALLFWPREPEGVEVIGDGAREVAGALDLAEGVGLRAVLLRREGRLRHLPDYARLCRGRCGPGLTVLRVLGPGGGGRLVFEMSGMDGIEALDEGEKLPVALVRCIVDAIEAELSGARVPDCIGDRRVRFVLPYGL